MTSNELQKQAETAMNVMTTAAKTLREVISTSLPVANTQIMTVSIPGTVIDYNDYLYDAEKIAFSPISVRVNEARLVDGMLPLSKITMGKTGRSVARSYMAALDALIPVEASVSGLIANLSGVEPEGHRKIIKDRYDGAMTYLKSQEEDATGNPLPKSKLTKYVEKQDMWAEAVEKYAIVQERQQVIFAKQYPNAKEQREAFMQWLQAHARDFKAAIQARYMDWVVHGYKFNVEFNFGIVDISSGMKRIEASKDAYRNLIIIGEDGFTEYNQVKLDPPDWATIVQKKVLQWNNTHKSPTPSEIKAEIKRLRNLLISHQALAANVAAGTFHAVLPKATNTEDEKLRKAYEDAYKKSDEENWNLLSTLKAVVTVVDPLETLRKVQNEWKSEFLSANRGAVANMEQAEKDEVNRYLQGRIGAITSEIDELQKALPSAKVLLPGVMEENGIPISPEDLKRDPGLFKPPTSERTKEKDEPSPWTKITAKVSSSKSESEKVTSESASSFAAKAGWGWFGGASASGAEGTTSTKAISSMANLDIELSMECIVVNIYRPWLHEELFSDSELDVSPDFPLSPGEEALHETVEKNGVLDSRFQGFPAYPTAFVVAANVELSFNGDTSALESSLEASSTEANASIGWGPFGVSASHKQSQNKSKTRTETTATGMRISLQAPQIIGWVQTLLPKLPKDPAGKSRMEGIKSAPVTTNTDSAPQPALVAGT